jgi:outer membrane protein assembly factor BamC
VSFQGRKIVRDLALLAVLASVTGCGVFFGDSGMFRNSRGDYLRASSMEPLVVPPGFDDETVEDIYYVPPLDANAPPAKALEVSRPQPLVAGDFDSMVTIQSLGQEQWVLVRLLPGQVWPRVRDFLIQRRVGVGTEIGDQGVIQSPWISNAQAAFDEIYRFQLSQGVQRNTTEVRVVQAQRVTGGVTTQRTEHLLRGQDWTPSSDDPRRARLISQQFANYLAGSADANAPVSLMAQGISTSRRLYTVQGEQPLLRVNLGSDRAWASLGMALDKGGFEVLQESRAKSTYSVVPPVLEGEGAKKQNRFLAIFKPSSYRKDKAGSESYRIQLEAAPQSDWMQIRVLPDSAAQDATVVPAEKQQLLLMQVKAFLT